MGKANIMIIPPIAPVMRKISATFGYNMAKQVVMDITMAFSSSTW